jgi:hypothetical protein
VNGAKRRKSQSAALTTILGIHCIVLPAEIQNMFRTWKKEPSQFWTAHEANSGIRWNSGESFENVVTNVYVVVQHLRLRRPWDTILWRFYAIFFYMLGVMLAHGARNKSECMHERLLKALQQSGKIADEIVVIDENLRSWTAAGFKYHQICHCLGKGTLFLLPQVPDKVKVSIDSTS